MLLMVGCGSTPEDPISSKKIDLENSCTYLGRIRYFPSLDVFCSVDDFKKVYGDYELQGKFYFKIGTKDILIAPFLGFNFVDSSPRIKTKAELKDLFVKIVGANNYSAKSKINKSTILPCQSGDELMTVETKYSGLQRLYEYCSIHPKKKNLFVIYLEGHGDSAKDIGLEHMEFLASLGYRVFYSDMPLIGTNKNELNFSHHDLGEYEQIGSDISPIFSEFIFPVGEFIKYLTASSLNSSITLFGRSGGGWRSYVAGSFYDVDYVVSVAGGLPHSMRLSAPWDVYEIGDWEQWSPKLYSVIGHEDFMLFSGQKGSLYIYNSHDPCCFRLNRSDLYFNWVKNYRLPNSDIYVDENHRDHSFGYDSKKIFIEKFKTWGF